MLQACFLEAHLNPPCTKLGVTDAEYRQPDVACVHQRISVQLLKSGVGGKENVEIGCMRAMHSPGLECIAGTQSTWYSGREPVRHVVTMLYHPHVFVCKDDLGCSYIDRDADDKAKAHELKGDKD
jgi:hypothetical protein